MNEIAAIDFANQVFYEAFAGVDFAAMSRCWAENAPVACAHPGAGPIFGRERVLESWRGIFSGMSRFPIRYRTTRVELVGGLGIAHSIELLEGATLVATNLFVKEGKVWRMVHHHAGPANIDPESVEEVREDPVN